MDDQRTDRTGGAAVNPSSAPQIAKAFFMTVIFVACAFAIAFTMYGIWMGLHPRLDRVGKGDWEAKRTFAQRVVDWNRAGLTFVAICGLMAGIAIVLIRLAKKIRPTT